MVSGKTRMEPLPETASRHDGQDLLLHGLAR
jgi:hypothetical protein